MFQDQIEYGDTSKLGSTQHAYQSNNKFDNRFDTEA